MRLHKRWAESKLCIDVHIPTSKAPCLFLKPRHPLSCILYPTLFELLCACTKGRPGANCALMSMHPQARHLAFSSRRVTPCHASIFLRCFILFALAQRVGREVRVHKCLHMQVRHLAYCSRHVTPPVTHSISYIV